MNHRIAKYYGSYWGFTIRCTFVEYGDPSTPSWSYWLVPGTWVEEE
jgi:hypothetical protein